MRGTIEKYVFLKKWVSDFPGIIEIYADVNFDIEMDYPEFIVLCKGDFSLVDSFNALQKFYEGNAKLYMTKDPMDPLLVDKRIIYFEGGWYI